jgi:hypothetical protein
VIFQYFQKNIACFLCIFTDFLRILSSVKK